MLRILNEMIYVKLAWKWMIKMTMIIIMVLMVVLVMLVMMEMMVLPVVTVTCVIVQWVKIETWSYTET